MRDANNAPAVAYCTNKANVVCSSKSPVGGVVGSIAGAAGNDLIKVTGCANSGEISGTQANNQVGGIVGRATIDTEISQSYNTGSITAMGSASGIIARMGNQCYSQRLLQYRCDKEHRYSYQWQQQCRRNCSDMYYSSRRWHDNRKLS